MIIDQQARTVTCCNVECAEQVVAMAHELEDLYHRHFRCVASHVTMHPSLLSKLAEYIRDKQQMQYTPAHVIRLLHMRVSVDRKIAPDVMIAGVIVLEAKHAAW